MNGTMLYQAYQAHGDAHVAVAGARRRPRCPDCAGVATGVAGERARAGRRRLRGATPGGADASRGRRFGIDRVRRSTNATCRSQWSRKPCARRLSRRCCTFSKDAPEPRTAGAARRAHVGTLRDAVARHRADHAVPITTSTSPTGTTRATCRSCAGRFGLDEYTEHLIDFLEALGPGAHVMAICQPCVAALAAVALMSEDDHPATPASLTLMAGPIDCRISPTAVNKLATDKPIDWFAQEPDRAPCRCAMPGAHAPRVSGIPAAHRRSST